MESTNNPVIHCLHWFNIIGEQIKCGTLEELQIEMASLDSCDILYYID